MAGTERVAHVEGRHVFQQTAGLGFKLGGDGGAQARLFFGAEGLGLLGVEVGLNQ